MPNHLAHALIAVLMPYLPVIAKYVVDAIGKLMPALVLLAAWRLRSRGRNR